MDDLSRGNWLLLGQAACEFVMLLPGRRLWRSRSSIAAISGGLIAVGVGLGFSAAGALGRQLRLHPVPPVGAVLRTAGPYRLVRHPMYVGMLLVATGVAMLRARALSILAVAGMAVVLSSKATLEERHLLRRFPSAYREYCSGGRRGLPTTPWLPAEDRF